jgi:hypothetical protein
VQEWVFAFFYERLIFALLFFLKYWIYVLAKTAMNREFGNRGA